MSFNLIHTIPVYIKSQALGIQIATKQQNHYCSADDFHYFVFQMIEKADVLLKSPDSTHIVRVALGVEALVATGEVLVPRVACIILG